MQPPADTAKICRGRVDTRRTTIRGLWPTATLALIAILSLTAAATAERPAGIAVDGVIEAAYGPPVASDPPGDGNGNAVMDLLNLYITEDADNFYFAFTINADVTAVNWGKYVIYIDTTNDANGAPSDAWTRNVVVNDPHKPEYGLYSWVDCTYGPACTQFWAWSGGWGQSGTLDGAALSTTGITSTLEWRVEKGRLGNPAEFWCEVWSTGGSSHDNAQDTINDPADDWNASDWSTQAVLLNSTHYIQSFFGPSLTVDSPRDGERFLSGPITVTGLVSPAREVTVTVVASTGGPFTPTVEPDGDFVQPGVPLVGPVDFVTVTAWNLSGTATVVRQVRVGPAAQDGDVEWWGVGHNSHDLVYREPFGAVPAEADVTLRLRTYQGDVTGAAVRVWDDLLDTESFFPMSRSATITDPAGLYEYWEVQFTTPADPTIWWYKFVITDTPDADWYEDDDNLGGWGRMLDSSTAYGSFQLTVYDPAFYTPQWMRDAVVYQIFPDRFRNGLAANDPISGTGFVYGDTVITYTQWHDPMINPRDPASPFYNRWSLDFYGGDLQGVLDRLDYLQELGVNAIYLNPIFTSPSNHRYDTTSYEEIDPDLGDLATFQALAQAAAGRGMHLIVDGVFNHTSSDSLYFDRYGHYGPPDGGCESLTSDYRGWYRFDATGECGGCVAGIPYHSWWGYCSLPTLQSSNPAVRDYFYGQGAFGGTDSVGEYWLRQGASGWRLDVGGDLDPGADDPTNTYWEEFRQAVRAVDPEAVIIGEEWGDASRWLLGREWDAVMNYRFRGALLSFLRDTTYVDNDANAGSSTGELVPIGPGELDLRLKSIQEDYPPPAWYAMMNLVGSHDTNRVLFVLNECQGVEECRGDFAPDRVAAAKAKLKLLAVAQFTLPGAPTIYYGDEAGSYYPSLAVSPGGLMEDDPYNRVTFPWPDEEGYEERPFGFDQALFDHYAFLARLRHAHPALRTGSFDTLLTDDKGRVYAYGRRLGDDVALVILNASPQAHDVTLSLAGYLPDGTLLRDALNGGATYTISGGRLTVPGVAGRWGSLLLLPPDLAGSGKNVAPATVEPGEWLTCSLDLHNSGPGRAAVVLTDLLPGEMEVVTAVLPAELTYDANGHRLLGKPVLDAGQGLLWQVPLRVRADAPPGVVTNVLWLDDGLGTVISRTAQVTIAPPALRFVYLPVVLKNHE